MIEMDPSTLHKSNLEFHVVMLPNLLYDAIVDFFNFVNCVSFNLYRAILIVGL
jgi:hypothetical protein